MLVDWQTYVHSVVQVRSCVFIPPQVFGCLKGQSFDDVNFAKQAAFIHVVIATTTVLCITIHVYMQYVAR